MYDNEQQFFLYSSSDMQLLAKQLALIIDVNDEADENGGYLFEKIFHTDKILVQSRGLEKYLNISLASENSVTGNIFYPFPTSFINNEIFAKLFKKQNFYQYKDYFSPQKMAWRIYIELKKCLNLNEFASFRKYLDGAQQNIELRYFQLANVIAEHFDRYLVFRPDLIVAWDNGQNPLVDDDASHWQKILWNRISVGATEYHFAALYYEFMQQVGDLIQYNFNSTYRPKSNDADLFNVLELDLSSIIALKRIFLFGFSSMPPAFLDIFNVLSHVIEVHFFYLNPCVEDWSYSQSLKDYYKNLQRTNVLGRSSKIADFGIDFLGLDFEFENNLLGSWGKQGREFFHLLQNINGVRYYNLDENYFSDGYGNYNFEQNSILQKVQYGIKTLSTVSDENINVKIVAKDDNSISVNSCHSPLRELEVLKNYLLRLFEQDKDLKVGDILVMIPDIEKYSPYIEAVFKTNDFRDSQWMYSTIADCSNALNSPEVAIFFKLLNLLESDCRVSEILEILNSNVILERYNIDNAELKDLNNLIEKNAIAYGFEDENLSNGNSEKIININSWHSGLLRMLGGYAILGNKDYNFYDEEFEQTKIFSEDVDNKIIVIASNQIVADDTIEGNNIHLVGKLYDFVEAICDLRCRLKEAKKSETTSLIFYFEIARSLIDEFFSNAIESAKLLHGAVNNIATQAEYSIIKEEKTDINLVLEQKFSLDAFRELLKNNFNLSINSGNFLHGGITFCKAQPMRSIPAKVLCLLGLGEKFFPRKTFDSAFNLMNNKRRFGDRNAKDDDRYFFLETVLSAKEKLYLSYVGQSSKDNSELVASSVIEELLNYIDASFIFEDNEGVKISERLRIFHPLNGYHPQYFEKNDKFLCNYSRSEFMAMQKMLKPNSDKNNEDKYRRLKQLFIQQNCNNIGEEKENIKFSELISYFLNPSRYYVNNVLNLDIKHYQNNFISDYENLEVSKRNQRQIFNELIEDFPQSVLNFYENRALNDKKLYQYNFLKGSIPQGEMGKIMFEQTFEMFHEPFKDFAQTFVKKIQLEKNPVIDFNNLNCSLEFDLGNLYLCRDNHCVNQLFLHYNKIYENNSLSYMLSGIALSFCRQFQQHMFDENYKISECLAYSLQNNDVENYTFCCDYAGFVARFEALIEIFSFRNQYPLPFFIKSFFRIHEAINVGKYNSESDKLTLINKIVTNWRKTDYNKVFCDGDDDFVRYCFGEQFDLKDEFTNEFLQVADLFTAILNPNSEVEIISELKNKYFSFRSRVFEEGFANEC